MNIRELKQQRAFALKKAEAITAAAEGENREMTDTEAAEYQTAVLAVQSLTPQIKKIEARNTLFQHVENGMLVPAGGGAQQGRTPGAPPVLSEEYYAAFFDYIASRGQHVSAALYEGSNPAGGYVTPIVVDNVVVPLAPQEMGVRSIAHVIPTASDIKIPTQSTYSTAAVKAEGDGGGTNLFTNSDPTLAQFTLSAFMVGVVHDVSWELAQDVESFVQFGINDLVVAIQQWEEGKFISGTGSAQPQGLLGNVGTGITGVVAGSDVYASELLNATLDVQGQLNAIYHKNASFLMSRATGTTLKKAQLQANLFAPAFTRENGQDYLWGFPVVYSSSMPSIAAGHTPVLFGDFRAGYVVGDRGGAGINIKILDQPKATEGLISLLGYRRTDGRVRRSEAIQAITLHT